MLLKDVALVLYAEGYPRLYRSDFAFRARSTCNFVSRILRAFRFETSNFWRVLLVGHRESKQACGVLGGDVLAVGVKFDQVRYETLVGEQVYEFFLEMLTEGFSIARASHDVPYNELMEAVDRFRDGGYRNEWVHKKRLFRGRDGLRGTLLCSMDLERFVLTLRLERKGVLLYESDILETKPDEICFGHQFKDLAIEGEKLIVTSRVSKPLLQLDLSALASA